MDLTDPAGRPSWSWRAPRGRLPGYWEHMPLARARKPVGPDLQLYRRFTWGQMATFNVLDGRQYRSDQHAPCAPRATPPATASSTSTRRAPCSAPSSATGCSRTWPSTKARWNVLAQQTAFAPLNRGLTFPPRFSGANADNWEGYVAERQQIIDWAVEHETPNFVVLTGDSHRNWVRNIPRHYSSLEEPDGRRVPRHLGLHRRRPASGRELLFGRPNNPQLLLQNNNRGYCKCTLTEDTWTSEYRIVTTVRQPTATVSSLATFVVENGVPGATRVAPA